MKIATNETIQKVRNVRSNLLILTLLPPPESVRLNDPNWVDQNETEKNIFHDFMNTEE